MKKKSIYLIVGIALIILIGVIILAITKKDNGENNECLPLSGGGYSLKFESNGGSKVEDIHVCIACPPNVYEDIPVSEKDGYTFDGWYYDKDLKNKVNVTNTMNIGSIPKYDENNCHIGYHDITLYAKWK